MSIADRIKSLRATPTPAQAPAPVATPTPAATDASSLRARYQKALESQKAFDRPAFFHLDESISTASLVIEVVSVTKGIGPTNLLPFVSIEGVVVDADPGANKVGARVKSTTQHHGKRPTALAEAELNIASSVLGVDAEELLALDDATFTELLGCAFNNATWLEQNPTKVLVELRENINRSTGKRYVNPRFYALVGADAE